MEASISLDLVHALLLVDAINLRVSHNCLGACVNEDCQRYTESGGEWGVDQFLYGKNLYGLSRATDALSQACLSSKSGGSRPWKCRACLALAR